MNAATDDLLIRPAEESARRIALEFLAQATAAAARLADQRDAPDQADAGAACDDHEAHFADDPHDAHDTDDEHDVDNIDAAHDARGADDRDALHDFRVALRRLRSTLRAYPAQLETALGRKLRRRLRRVVRRTGDGRDAEVAIGWIERLRAEIPPRARLAAARLAADLEVERAAGYELARKAAIGFRDVAAALERRLGSYRMQVDLANASAFEPFGAVAARAIEERVESLRSALARPLSRPLPDDDEAAHRARIAGKRLRYLLEPLRVGHEPSSVERLLGSLRDLQNLLGELQDLRILAGRIETSMVDAAARRQREIVAAALAAEPGAAEDLRSSLRRASPAAPLVGLLAPLAARRAQLRARLERDWLAGGAETLLADCDRWLAGLRSPGRARSARP